MNRIMVSDSVNSFCPLADDFGLLIEEAEIASRPHEADRFRDAQCFSHWPALQRIDAAGWESGKREVDGHVQPPLPVSPPKNVGQLAFEIFDAADKLARSDGGQCLFDESGDAPTIADLISETRVAFDADAAVIGEELSSCGWSPTEAKHRGRLYRLRKMLAGLEADEPGEVEAGGRPALRVEPASHVKGAELVPVSTSSDTGIPDTFRRPGGLIERYTDWILSQSYKPQWELAFGAALAIMSVLTGRKIRSHGGVRTNVYVLAVAASGAGKEAPRSCIKRLFAAVGLGGILSEGAVSGAGVLAACRDNPVRLFCWDEYGLVLQANSDKNAGPHLRSINSNFLRLFTSAGSVFVGEARADMRNEAAVSIVEPHAVLYASSTPDTLFPAFDETSVNSGQLGRHTLVIGHNGYIEPNLDLVESDIPVDVVNATRWWVDYNPGGGDFKILSPQPRVVAMTDEASILYREWSLRRDREAYQAGGWRQTLLVRAGEHATKLILLHAVSLDRESRAAGVESVAWGTGMADFLLGRLADLAAVKIASNPYERTQNELVEFIVSKGAIGATSNELAQRFKKIKARDRKEALEHAKEAGRITEEIRPSRAGRPAVVYLAANG